MTDVIVLHDNRTPIVRQVTDFFNTIEDVLFYSLIPHSWYKHITKSKGVPDYPACVLLAHLVYRHRATVVDRDGPNGTIQREYRQRFDGDYLVVNPALLSLFGTKKVVREALNRLEKRGLIKTFMRSSTERCVELIFDAIVAITEATPNKKGKGFERPLTKREGVVYKNVSQPLPKLEDIKKDTKKYKKDRYKEVRAARAKKMAAPTNDEVQSQKEKVQTTFLAKGKSARVAPLRELNRLASNAYSAAQSGVKAAIQEARAQIAAIGDPDFALFARLAEYVHREQPERARRLATVLGRYDSRARDAMQVVRNSGVDPDAYFDWLFATMQKQGYSFSWGLLKSGTMIDAFAARKKNGQPKPELTVAEVVAAREAKQRARMELTR